MFGYKVLMGISYKIRSINNYHIWENIRGGKLSRFEWKIAIHGKTFAVAFLQTYIADQQGHD